MTVNDNGVQWFYKSPNDDEHGPFTGKEMMDWLEGGYFHDKLLIRTQHEREHHTLRQFTQALGSCPFLSDVRTYPASEGSPMGAENGSPPMPYPPQHPKSAQELTERQRHFMQMAAVAMRLQNQPPPNVVQPAAPMMYSSAPPTYPVHHPVYPQMMAPPHTMTPYGMPMMPSHTPSQVSYMGGNSRPPSEPENGFRSGETPASNASEPRSDESQNVKDTKGTSTEARCLADVGTDPILFKGDAQCQTEPIKISLGTASELLSKIFGQDVLIEMEEPKA
ncbi:hypothetical protein L596_028494 [Steinernema carpocapsae]|uniref:GYF domain-containing protein n=1 Tax=Steinernema carpocapsae TaxID=34508 RepID=A0A4U5LYL7_STECR|nr:hypothetical protein L596_028494 [Steinernema carpocapsae]